MKICKVKVKFKNGFYLLFKFDRELSEEWIDSFYIELTKTPFDEQRDADLRVDKIRFRGRTAISSTFFPIVKTKTMKSFIAEFKKYVDKASKNKYANFETNVCYVSLRDVNQVLNKNIGGKR